MKLQIPRIGHRNLGIFAAIVLVTISIFSLLERDGEGFEIPTVGTFAGVINWNTNPATSAPIILHRLSRSPELLVVIGGQRPIAERIALSLNEPIKPGPLSLDNGQYTMTTDSLSGGLGGYQGSIRSSRTSDRGAWRVALTEVAPRSPSPNAGKWGNVYYSVQQASSLARNTETDLRLRRDEIDRLNRIIVERSDFRDAAKNRLGKTSESLKQAQESLDAIRNDLIPLERRLSIASKITPRGKLVALARESLERESDWILSTLQKIAPEVSKDFERGLEKARRVTELKEAIEIEQHTIDRLKEPRRVEREVEPEPSPMSEDHLEEEP